MCTRADAETPIERLQERYRRKASKRTVDYTPTKGRLHARAFPELPGIAAQQPDTIGMFRWGFLTPGVPVKDADERARNCVNARSEDLLQTKTFVGSWTQGRRCVILVDRYIEYKHEPVAGRKTTTAVPYRFEYADGGPVCLGGIYSVWNNTVTFAILTKDSVGRYEDVHTRMPIIIPDAQLDVWLSPAGYDSPEIQGLLWQTPLLEIHRDSGLAEQTNLF